MDFDSSILSLWTWSIGVIFRSIYFELLVYNSWLSIGVFDPWYIRTYNLKSTVSSSATQGERSTSNRTYLILRYMAIKLFAVQLSTCICY